MGYLVAKTTKKEFGSGFLFFILGFLIFIGGLITSKGNLVGILLFTIFGLSLPFLAMPPYHQFKYTGEDYIILSYNSLFFGKRVYLKDIVGVSFVPLIWTPVMQAITKQEYSNKMMIFFCYKEKGKIKTQKILVYKNDALKIKNLITQMNIKIISSEDFYKMGGYKCSEYLNKMGG